MRALALFVIAALNGALLWGWRDRERRRDELIRLEEEVDAQRAAVRQSAVEERDLRALLQTARARLPEPELDIDVLRDLLVAEERGLDIDRLSLEFHPGSSPPAGGVSGGAIQATLEGSFDALYRYLGRIEALHLPLAPEELSLRRAAQGERLTLAVRWSASWSIEPASPPRQFTASELSALGRWIAREPTSAPKRDLFALGILDSEARGREEREPPRERLPPPEASVESIPAAVPRLTGYVLARPELEADPSRRVLAALRFEGELWLVKVGDVLGSFRVEGIEPRESVLLVDERTGERLKLFLE